MLTPTQTSWKSIESFGDNTLIFDVPKDDNFKKPVPKLRRVMWIIFDELDLRLAFSGGLDGLDLIDSAKKLYSRRTLLVTLKLQKKLYPLSNWETRCQGNANQVQ